MSPCRHSERAATATREPSAAVTAPWAAIPTARATTASGSRSTAPGSPRGTRVPAGVYARSAKASGTAVSPAASAADSSSEPGRPRTGRPAAPAAMRTPATTAPAWSASYTVRLYSAPCGFTYDTREPAARAKTSSAPIWYATSSASSPAGTSIERRPKPARSRYETCAPIRTPRSAASSQTRRMMDGSPAWKPQATLALVTTDSRASSSVSVQRPKPSPRSALRSIRGVIMEAMR